MTNTNDEEMVRGKLVKVHSFTIHEKTLICGGGLCKIARLKDEWYHDVEEPERIILTLQRAKHRPDIFTFWQRLPHVTPRYPYYMEHDSIAALPIETYDLWYTKQINTNARRAIKKAQKNGIVLRMADFNEDFVRGMTSIFNETPIRQGKPFWHYGKDFETVKKQFSRYLYREDLIGAYYHGQLIGFIMLGYAGDYAELGQIISKIEHRDKFPNNALIAKAVRLCEEKKISYLTYGFWKTGNWGEFPRRNGFTEVKLPRYYIPLTIKGQTILKLKMHRGVKGILPNRLMTVLLELRKEYYKWVYRGLGRSRAN